jgi:hypothetical protein
VLRLNPPPNIRAMPLAAAPHSLYYLTEIRAEIFLDFKNPTPQNISPMVAENIF